MSKLIEITKCEVCHNQDLNLLINLGDHPMCDDLVLIGEQRYCTEYPIDIVFCKKCSTAHQKFQIPKEDLFPKSYHYRSRFTADVIKGMSALVVNCEAKFGPLKLKKVLDIGCNDGSLLDLFSEKGALTFGIEPTDAFKDASPSHTILNEYLNPDIALQFVKSHGHPDFISFTNVFAHIEDLTSVIEALRILMSNKTILVIENHYLGSVINKNQFDTFYHEHPRTYSVNSFIQIACSLSTNIIDVEFPSRYGGNVRVFFSDEIIFEKIDLKLAEILKTESNFYNDLVQMNLSIKKWKVKKRNFILDLYKKHGPLIAKAFPGRSAIPVKLLELDEVIISAVYEKSKSMKIGHYVPGTRIPICSDDQLFTMNYKGPIINFAWHISDEIRDYLSLHNISNEIIDIINNKDFSDK